MTDTCNLSRPFAQVMVDREEEGGKRIRTRRTRGSPPFLLRALLIGGRCSLIAALDVTKELLDTFPPLEFCLRGIDAPIKHRDVCPSQISLHFHQLTPSNWRCESEDMYHGHHPCKGAVATLVFGVFKRGIQVLYNTHKWEPEIVQNSGSNYATVERSMEYQVAQHLNETSTF